MKMQSHILDARTANIDWGWNFTLGRRKLNFFFVDPLHVFIRAWELGMSFSEQWPTEMK